MMAENLRDRLGCRAAMTRAAQLRMAAERHIGYLRAEDTRYAQELAGIDAAYVSQLDVAAGLAEPAACGRQEDETAAVGALMDAVDADDGSWEGRATAVSAMLREYPCGGRVHGQPGCAGETSA